MEVKVSKDKHISIWTDWENLICIRWNIKKKKTVHKDEDCDQ